MTTTLAQTFGGGGGSGSEPQTRGVFFVDDYVKGFRVDLAGYLRPLAQADGTLFWDDDTLPGAKGIILEPYQLNISSAVALFAWNVTGTVGSNAAAGVSGTNGARVFIRTHGADGVTPVGSGAEAGVLQLTLENGAIGRLRASYVVAPTPTATRALSGFLSPRLKVEQAVVETEVSYSVETYQSQTVEVVGLGDLAINTDPINARYVTMLFTQPCGTTYQFPASPTSWNNSGFLMNCDQGAEYTFAAANVVGYFLPQGTDTTAYYILTAETVFTYDI